MELSIKALAITGRFCGADQFFWLGWRTQSGRPMAWPFCKRKTPEDRDDEAEHA